MAAKTQFRLLLHQQKIDLAGIVGAMARGAADAIRQVRRLAEILRLQAGLMTLRADGRGLRRTQFFEANDLVGVAASVDVSLRRAMAALTPMLLAFQ